MAMENELAILCSGDSWIYCKTNCTNAYAAFEQFQDNMSKADINIADLHIGKAELRTPEGTPIQTVFPSVKGTQYEFTFRITGYYNGIVGANTLTEAKQKATKCYESADFGDASNIDAVLQSITPLS